MAKLPTPAPRAAAAAPGAAPQRDSAATVDKIVAAVQAVLETEGVHGVSLRRVAKVAGLSLGTVQYYFATKQALIEGCLEENGRWLTRMVMESVRALGTGTDAARFVEEATRHVFRIARDQRGFVRLRMMTVLEQGDRSEQASRLFMFELLDRIVALLAKPGADKVELRLTIQTLIFAAARYALLGDAEMLRLTAATDVPTALTRLENHVVRLAREVVSGARGPSPGG